MATVAISSIAVGSSTPSATQKGTIWMDTSEKYLKVLNDNSVWTKIFKYNNSMGGITPTSGCNITDTISGSHGNQPIDSPAFTTTMTLNGDDVALEQDVDDAVGILSEIISDTPAPQVVTGYIYAMKSGIIEGTIGVSPETFTLPLPEYYTGETAVVGDCYSIISYLYSCQPSAANKAKKWLTVVKNSEISYTVTLYFNGPKTVNIGYLIMAKKKVE